VQRGGEWLRLAILKVRVLVGGNAFLEAMKQRVTKVSKEQPDRKILDKFVSWERIIEVVERLQGKKWDEFREVHGDMGRDLVLYLARERSGQTLKEIGNRVGGLDYKSVGKAVERFRRRLGAKGRLQAITNRCLREMSDCRDVTVCNRQET